MTQISDDPLAEVIARSVRTLSLGRALSPVQPASLSVRSGKGFRLARLQAGPAAAQPPVVELAADGTSLSNDPHAALDSAELHAAVLAARPQAGAVVLIRAPRQAAWGLSRRALPVRYFQMFGYTRAQQIPVVAPIAEAITGALQANADVPALLLTDGRSLIWAQQPDRAVRLVLSLEEAAHVTLLADHLGGAQDYPAAAREKIYASLQAQARH